jgi:RNA polymerase sigma-70 factor (ECF subfamily)
MKNPYNSTYAQLDTRSFTPMETATYTLTYCTIPDAQNAPQKPASLSVLPDEDLMVLITQGIVEGPMAELFRRHNRALFNFVAWSCQGNHEEAEEICRKTWVNLMRTQDYQPIGAFQTFLYQIARDALVAEKRAQYQLHAVPNEAEAMPDDDISPETELRLRRNLPRVRKALMELPVLQREVVVLRFFSELSLEEIAASIGVGFDTVKNRLRYAFIHLRRDLERAE